MRGRGAGALTARGRGPLVCGLAAIVYARLFGTADSRSPVRRSWRQWLIARIWVGLAGGPHVALRSLPPFARAGDRMRWWWSCGRWRAPRPGAASFREVGAGAACPLRPVDLGGLRVLRGSYELGPLRRGLHELRAGELIREDPFGLARRIDATRGATR